MTIYRSKAISLVCTLLVCLQSVSFGFEPADSQCLSAQIFMKPEAGGALDENAVKAYVRYLIESLRKEGRDISSVTIGDLKAIQAHDKRMAITSFSKISPDSYLINCTVNGVSCFATIGRTPDGGCGVTVNVPRYFPAETPIAVDPAALSLASDIVAQRWKAAAETDADVASRTLASALAAVLKTAFVERGMFMDVANASSYFEGENGSWFDHYAPVVWSPEAEEEIGRLAVEAGTKLSLNAEIALIMSALGHIFYDQRTPECYRKSEFFSRIAHELQPDNVDHYHAWVWALYHCRRLEEARQHLQRLLEVHPDSEKILIDMAYLELEATRLRLDALEKADLSRVASDTFMEEEAALRSSLLGIASLSTGRSRGISLLGAAYHYLARLELISGRYGAFKGAAADEDVGPQVLAVRDIAMSLSFLRQGYHNAAGYAKATDGQLNHAASMLETFAEKNYGLLVHCDEAIRGRAAALSGEAAAIADKALKDINTSANDTLRRGSSGLDPRLATDIRARAAVMRSWVTASTAADDAFRQALRGIDLDDIADEEGLFRRARERAVGAAVSVQPAALSAGQAELLAGRLESRYRSAGLFTGAWLAALYVCADAIRNDQGVAMDRLRKDAAAILDLAGLQEAEPELGDAVQFREGLLRRAGAIGLKVAETAQAAYAREPARQQEQPFRLKDEPIDAVDNLTIRQSVDPGSARAFPSRIERLERIQERLQPWIGARQYCGSPEYVTGLADETCRLRKVIDIYAVEAEGYLAASGRPKLSRQEREKMHSERREISRSYIDINQRLNWLDALCEKRERYFEHLISADLVSLKTEALRCRHGYEQLNIDWLLTEYAIFDGYLGDAALVAQPKSENYLAYTDYLFAVDRARAVLAAIGEFGRRLDSFKSVFEALHAAESEISKQEVVFGRQPALREFRDRLGEVRRFIFRDAAEGRTLESVSDGQRAFYATIDERVAVLGKLREDIERALETAEDAKSSASNNRVRRDKTIKPRVTLMVGEDMFGTSRFENPVVRSLDLNLPALSTDEAAGIIIKAMDLISALYTVFIGQIRAEGHAEEVMAMMLRRAPGLIGQQDIAIMTELSSEIRQAFKAAGTLSIFDPDFNRKSFEVPRAHAELVLTYLNAMTLVSAAYHRAITENLRVCTALFETWLENWNWPLENITPAERRKLVGLLGLFADSIGTAEGRDLTSSAKEASEMFVSMLGKVKEDSFFFARFKTLGQESMNRYFDHIYPDMARQGRVSMDVLSAPVYKEDGTVASIEICVYPMNPDRLEFRHTLLPLVDRTADTSIMREVNGVAAAAVADHNRVLSAAPQAPASLKGIYLDPECFMLFMIGAMQFYIKQLPADDNPEWFEMKGGPIGLDHAVVSGIPEIMTQHLSVKLAADRIADELAAKLRQSRREARDMLALALALNERLITRGMNTPEGKSGFLRNMGALFRAVTGRDLQQPPAPDAPRPSLTVPGGRATLTIAPFYVADPDYAGVAYDPAKRSFYLSGARRGSRSAKLRDALNGSLAGYLKLIDDGAPGQLAIAGLPGFGQTSAAVDMYREILDKAGAKGPIAITVTKGLGTNSLCVSNTVIFDKDFLEFLMNDMNGGGSAGGREAASVILGERIMHELGLLSIPWDPYADIQAQLIRHETEQTMRDITLYGAVFSGRPQLAGELERYTGRQVADAATGGRTTFSRAFNTSGLYRRMQQWSAMIGSDRKKVSEEVTVFVRGVLERLELRTRYARPMLTAPAAAEGSSAVEAALAPARRLRDIETGVLDSLGSLEASALQKTRRILISSELIPGCQKTLIAKINSESKKAFDEGRTRDLIEIRPFDQISGAVSDERQAVALVLSATEAAGYRGGEARLAFSVDGANPIPVNGLVAAGRAVAYGRMDALRQILMGLGALAETDLPSAEELERLLKADRLGSLRAIAIPPVKILVSDYPEYNRTVVTLMQYA